MAINTWTATWLTHWATTDTALSPAALGRRRKCLAARAAPLLLLDLGLLRPLRLAARGRGRDAATPFRLGRARPPPHRPLHRRRVFDLFLLEATMRIIFLIGKVFQFDILSPRACATAAP